jgi:glycyl-tRNA synthetase beta chain
MHRYLLEVGTEELPVGFQASARQDLQTTVTQQLADWHAPQTATVTVWTTPRRITLIIDGLPDQQPDQTVRIQGPSAKVAQTPQGEWTPAAQGFARKNQVTTDDLTVENGYVVLQQHQPGQPFAQCVAQAVPGWILGLSGSHFMQWGSGTDRFSRPIRWVLSLWNNSLLPVTIAQVAATTHSVGHRVLGQASVPIAQASQYEATLTAQGVIPNHHTRQQHIAQQLQQAATQAGGVLHPDDDLLETMTALVECPHVITGQFDPAFLTVPDVVLTTVMKHHQKYASVYNAEGKLLPVFLAVANSAPQADANVVAGNQRVLSARFQDAAFFYQEDTQQPLAQRVEALKGLTFQKGLGTLHQKAQRLQAVAAQVASTLYGQPDTVALAERAALLCKADLTTGMVRELTELQGDMGQIYAQHSGEPVAVAQAIKEHYLPRFSGDVVAQTPTGITLALADKLDTLVAVFTQPGAKLPSGSKDPLALRRQANGIWQTLWAHPITLDLYPVMHGVWEQLAPFNPRPWAEAEPLLREFLWQRLNSLLLEKNLRLDWVQAVAAVCDPVANLAGFKARLDLLSQLSTQTVSWAALVQPATRVAKLLNAPAEAPPSAEALLSTVQGLAIPPEQDLEQALQQALLQLPTTTTSALFAALPALQPAIDTLFEQRMINDPDPAIKAIRVGLVQALDGLYRQLLDVRQLTA